MDKYQIVSATNGFQVLETSANGRQNIISGFPRKAAARNWIISRLAGINEVELADGLAEASCPIDEPSTHVAIPTPPADARSIDPLGDILSVSWNRTESAAYGVAQSRYNFDLYRLIVRQPPGQASWEWSVSLKDTPFGVFAKGKSSTAATARSQSVAAADDWDRLGRTRTYERGWRIPDCLRPGQIIRNVALFWQLAGFPLHAWARLDQAAHS